MIYYDHSEGRIGTRLAQSARDIAARIVGLEAQTGADLLISPVDASLPENVNRPPGSILLRKHIDSGMLIQRKSGGDLLNSIPKLTAILQRMQAQGSICWLLICGKYEPSADNKVICEGRETDWAWASLQGALDAWVLRGGYIHQEPDDEHGGDWIERWNHNIKKLSKEHVIQPPVQKISGGMFDPHPWRQTLMSFPDCGEELSRQIANYTDTLAHALWWMTDDTAPGHIKGIGVERRKAWRRWLRLADDEVLLPVKTDERYHVTEVPQPPKLIEQSLNTFATNGMIAVKELAF